MVRSIDSGLPGPVLRHETASLFHSRVHRNAYRIALGGAITLLLSAAPALAQVLTVDTNSGRPVSSNSPVDRQYRQVQPTHVALSTAPMDTRDKLEIVRIMQAEQGFAMRPLPGGHKGLTLEANGKLEPAGEAYLNMVTSNGMAVKPGGRVVVTDVKIDHNKLIFDLNDGPDAKHRFLRHISIGMGDPGLDTPVVQNGDQPGGSRITLAFKGHIPDLTGDQVKALLAPLISFDVKTPVQAYTDTLPKPLKEAILNHQVLVGMNTDMLIFAKGDPNTKYHEMEGQMPVDIWLYGKAPDPVTFVRINGNRVIRVEIARVGQPLQVFDKDVVSAMLTAAGQPTVEQADVHVIHEGDVQRDPDRQAPAPPPTLRNPGETTSTDSNQSVGVMKPVHFPKQQPDNSPNANPNAQPQGSSTQGGSSQGGSSQTGSGQPGSGQPASGSSAGQSTSGGNSPAGHSSSPAGQPPANSQPNSQPGAGQNQQHPAGPTTIGSNPDQPN